MHSKTSNIIEYATYFDKVLGGWIGKSLGGIIGAPFEAHKTLGDMTVENCWPRIVYPNDDLDIQVVWLEMLEERGPDFVTQDLVDLWQDRCWYNFAEYGAFLYNVQRGIAPPLSGTFNNEYYSESQGCPIRAEIWGMAAPGNPELAAEFARMDGELDHTGNSVWAEQFWAAAVAQAFVCSSLQDVLDAGRSVIPTDSDIHRISLEVPDLLNKHGDYRRVWKDLIRAYGDRDCSKAVINFAFTTLSIHTGNLDLKETIVTAINCAWDSDCTAGTAGALVGVMNGASNLPADWKEKLGDRLCCDCNVRHRDALLVDFARDTCAAGIEMALSRNDAVEIADVPPVVRQTVEQRRKIRQARPSVDMKITFVGEPVLYANKPSEVVLHIEYSGTARCTGRLEICSPEGIAVTSETNTIHLDSGENQDVKISIRRDDTGDTVWDKNLFQARLICDDGTEYLHTFGLGGARIWEVYGPYWDAWDTRKWETCPYRNDEIIVHPARLPGCIAVMNHQYAYLENEYLDERVLLKQSLPDEVPFIIEKGINLLKESDLGGFKGEACYYFMRELRSESPVECNVWIGATGPFVVWIDGEEVFRNEQSLSWFFGDYTFRASFDNHWSRIVVKAIRPGDDFRFSMSFVKIDIPGDKLTGHSYLIDDLGDRDMRT